MQYWDEGAQAAGRRGKGTKQASTRKKSLNDMVAPGDYSARGYGTGLDREDFINPDPGVPNDPSNVELGRFTVPWSDRFVPPVERRRTVRQSQRPKASPVPFAQQLAQSGMMSQNQPMRTREGQVIRNLTPGYSVNPSHPMWNYARGYTPPGGGPLPPQFSPDQNPMDYYGWDAFRGQWPYSMPGGVQGMQDVGSRGGQAPRQAVPRVWTEREMTPEGFQNIMGRYGQPQNYVPWIRQMQSMPYPVPMMPFGNMPVGF